MSVYCAIWDSDKDADALLRNFIIRYWPDAKIISTSKLNMVPDKDTLVCFAALYSKTSLKNPLLLQMCRPCYKLILIAKTPLLAPFAVKLKPYDYWIKPVTKDKILSIRNHFQ